MKVKYVHISTHRIKRCFFCAGFFKKLAYNFNVQEDLSDNTTKMPKEYVLGKKTEKDERHNKTCYDCEIGKELYHILQIEEKEEFLLKVKNAKKFVAEVTKVGTDNFKIRLIKVLNG